MSSAAVLSVLALGHILSGMCWLGGGVLTGFVIGPSLRTLPSNASLEFNAKVIPKITRFVEASIGSTFIFGILLLDSFYGGNFTPLSTTSQGQVLSAGIGFAVLAAVVGWSVTMPAFNSIARISAELLAGGQPAKAPDLAKYGKRARVGAMLGLALLLVALSMMVFSGFGLY
jgi:uncharacterized membrane protein